MMTQVSVFQENIAEYRVIHAIPGRIRLKVPNLTRFQAKLATQLESLAWVKSFRFNLAASSVIIGYSREKSGNIESLLGEILQKNSNKEILNGDQDKINGDQEETTQNQLESWSSLRLPLLATALSLASNRFDLIWLRALARGALVTAALPVAQRALQSLFIERKLNIDCLDLMALILSAVQGKLVTPSLVITLHELGDLIREHTARSTEQKTANLLDTIGRFAWVEREGKVVQINSDQVIVGETVYVYPGERIPVDGIVLQGEATVDQQQLTGESMPIVALAGTYVYASTLVRSGQIRLECERVGAQTRAAASIELLEKAPVNDTRMANYAAKMADKLIIPSMVLAGIVYATTGDPTRTASILTLDFVTGIRVSMPTAFLGALNHTTRHGVLVRSGRTLELLAEVDTVVFDKTGTLTQGNISVAQVQSLSANFSGDRLLQLAASAEVRITHPVAEAIVDYAKQRKLEILPRQEWNYSVGSGMEAKIEDLRILVGSEKFLYENGVIFGEFSLNSDWCSVIYVACEDQLIGYLTYTDPLRKESGKLIEKLQHDYGMEVHLLTGDNRVRAAQVAKTLDIPLNNVHAEAFPEDKAKIVRNLSRSGKVVAFVGDGLNDSVALAYSDVSISFADGSDIARETADVVLMNNDLTTIVEAIAIAKETQALIEQNTILVIAPNLLGLGFASTIGLNPLLATVIHNGTAIAAGLNSLRPLVQHQLETKT
jgi:P-type Cu2+ transporter